MATFDGSPDNDQYFGTAEADRILGLDGQDQLRGAGGDDHIEGGNGPDSLYGDKGSDEIFGDAGDDLVRGGRGSDTLHGGDGIDVLAGDRDDDLLFGDAGDDILIGSLGDDMIQGGAGADFISGGEGRTIWPPISTHPSTATGAGCGSRWTTLPWLWDGADTRREISWSGSRSSSAPMATTISTPPTTKARTACSARPATIRCGVGDPINRICYTVVPATITSWCSAMGR